MYIGENVGIAVPKRFLAVINSVLEFRKLPDLYLCKSILCKETNNTTNTHPTIKK